MVVTPRMLFSESSLVHIPTQHTDLNKSFFVFAEGVPVNGASCDKTSRGDSCTSQFLKLNVHEVKVDRITLQTKQNR